jgi:hypothetical protein
MILRREFILIFIFIRCVTVFVITVNITIYIGARRIFSSSENVLLSVGQEKDKC